MALGRPRKAAQSLDEALVQHYAGLSPKRPRNEFEREAMRKQKGRTVNPHSPTQVAAVYAAYLVKNDGLSLREATRVAALTHKVKADSIRKPARAMLLGPQVLIQGKTKVPWLGTIVVDKKRLPLLVSITNLS